MDGDGGMAHIEREFRDFIDQFRKLAEEAAASETLIASAEYELELVREAIRKARLS